MFSKFTYTFLLFFLLSTIGQVVKGQTLTVTINKKTEQVNLTASPVVFTVVFSAAINVATFTASTIVLSGTANGKKINAISQVPPNDGTTFEISVTATSGGTVMAAIPEAITSNSSSILSQTDPNPYGITIDNYGCIYTANYGSNDVSKITPEGISTIIGTTDKFPTGITIDNYGNIYTANVGANNVSKITPAGVSTIFGTTDNNPIGITIDSSGNIYTTNGGADNVTKITPAGVSSIFGTTGSTPWAITIDRYGNVYTANEGSNDVSKITTLGISSILGTTGAYPRGIAIDSSGNVYTSNIESNNVSKITPAGVSTILGTTGVFPFGITIDNLGNVYTANRNSNDVSKITPAGLSSILGTTDINPMGITIDNLGNFYTSNIGSSTVSKLITINGIALSGSTIPSNAASTSSDNGYVLPVNLLYFNAINSNCNTVLNWQTAAEINSSYYAIETSVDGIIFSENARLISKNSATGAVYAYTFNSVKEGTIYYRLKITDVDGSFTFSKIIALTANSNCGNVSQLKVSPNPAKDFVLVEGTEKGNRITIINAAGVLLSSMEATGTTQRISISSFISGVYMLRIEGKDGRINTIKVIKQ